MSKKSESCEITFGAVCGMCLFFTLLGAGLAFAIADVLKPSEPKIWDEKNCLEKWGDYRSLDLVPLNCKQYFKK